MKAALDQGALPVMLCLLVGCGTCSEPPSSPTEAPPGAGEATPAGQVAAVPEQTQRALEALGYFPTAPTDNPEDQGVTTHVASVATKGLNLSSSRRRASALLTDSDGELVHRWVVGRSEDPIWPWMHVEPLPNGELIVIAKDHHVAKRGWDSSLIWRRLLGAHHDLAIREDGHMLVLVRGRQEIIHRGESMTVLADGIATLSPDGEVQRQVELLPLLRDSVSPGRLDRIKAAVEEIPLGTLLRPGGAGDLLHANSIEILEREIPDVAPAGSLLLSFRALSRIAIVDAEVSEVLWMWGQGELDGQHDATQLDNGNILLFDNGLRRGSDSRVIEVNPVTREIEWTFAAAGFFSRLRGGAQELPGGNILITESDNGRAFEVTRSGEMVWEFWNPDVRPVEDEMVRGVIYRMNRFPESYFAQPRSD